MKKANNQGFSLVELIIVIAIMAVLIGVLAPQFIKYVENSREQKDASALAEVENAIEVALADEDVYEDVTAITSPTVPVVTLNVIVAANGTITTAAGDLEAELTTTLGDFELTSQKYPNGATITITETAAGTFTFATTQTAPPVVTP